MEKSKAQRVRFIYGIALSALTVLSGILFLVQALLIYYSGTEPPYSREIVAARLAQIQIPVWIWIAAVIAGGILWIVFPADAKKLTAPPDAKKTLGRLKKRLPQGLPEEYSSKLDSVKKEEKNRRVAWWICAAVCAACALLSALYMLNPRNFSSNNFNADIVAMVAHVIPFVILSFAAACGTVIYQNYSTLKELESVKSLLSEGAKLGLKPASAADNTETAGRALALLRTDKAKNITRLCLLVVGVAFVIWGSLNGGAAAVLGKAIKICTECIGLG